jgi:hypothetical protein
MPAFTVLRRVDAFVNYKVSLEAGSAEEASSLARVQEDALDWDEISTTTFDARLFVTLNEHGQEIEETLRGDF